MSAYLLQGFKGNSIAVSANHACTGTEACIRVTTGATDKTVTLPPASNGPQFIMVEKVDAGAGAVIVPPAGSDRVNGVVGDSSISQPTGQWDTFVAVSDGADNWKVLF